jgi:hypothetical protein
LSTDEFVAIRGTGFEPVGQVFGACVYNIGYVGAYGPAAGQVVPDGVVDEVGHQAFGQARVTCCRSSGESGDEADAAALGFGLAGQENVLGDVGEVQGFWVLEPALAVSQGEQRRDEALLLIGQFH